MFTIEVTYTTGSTFHSGRETECIDFSWTDFEKVKKAMTEMLEFVDFNTAVKSWGCSPEEKKMILGLARKMPWADDYEYDLSSMRIETESGERKYLCMSFCTGYFEKLESMKIVLTKDSGLCYDHYSSQSLDIKDLQRKYGARKNG